MFTAPLFTIAKTWKQPKYPSTGMDKEGAVYIYIYISAKTPFSHKVTVRANNSMFRNISVALMVKNPPAKSILYI